MIYVKKKKKTTRLSGRISRGQTHGDERDMHESDLQFSGKCIWLYCERSLLRLVASISLGERWTLLGQWGGKPGRKSAKRLFTYRSSDNSKTEEKWNKSGSLKARAKRPLPVKALLIHGTWGCENKN